MKIHHVGQVTLDICQECMERKGNPCRGLNFCIIGRARTLAKLYTEMNAIGQKLPFKTADYVSGFQMAAATCLNPVTDMISGTRVDSIIERCRKPEEVSHAINS